MAIYVVMEPPADSEDQAAERAVLVRDGFSFLAFIVPLVWLLWHRLWIEAALLFAAGVALVAAGEATGLAFAGGALSFLMSLFIGLEGQSLRVNAMRRRGWRECGVVEGNNAAEAEIRYLAGDGEATAAGPWTSTARPDGTPSRPLPVHAGPALGLLGYPGRS